MMCSRHVVSVAVTLGVSLATARPSSASVGEDDVREEPGKEPGEEPGEELGEDGRTRGIPSSLEGA